MERVVITVPKHRTREVVEYLQADPLIPTGLLIRGENGDLLQFLVTQSGVENLKERLAEIGGGLGFGQLTADRLETARPVPNPIPGLGLIRSETVSNEELYTTVSSGSYLSDQYLVFTVVASLIAGLGLATDNPTLVVSSMLISVLMNPILATIIGTLIREKELSWRGVYGESVGMLLAIFVGVVIGYGYWLTDEPYDWPTNEMLGRDSVSATRSRLAE